jgi:hypothetical protein
MEYTVECPYCNKRLKRAKYDTKLNEHKDRYGNRCYGRVGYMIYRFRGLGRKSVALGYTSQPATSRL